MQILTQHAGMTMQSRLSPPVAPEGCWEVAFAPLLH